MATWFETELSEIGGQRVMSILNYLFKKMHGYCKIPTAHVFCPGAIIGRYQSSPQSNDLKRHIHLNLAEKHQI